MDGLVREPRVIRSVTIYGWNVNKAVTRRKQMPTLTRLSNVLRFPTKTVSPSIKYAYNACESVRTMYLRSRITLEKLQHVWSRAENNAHDKAYPNNRLGLLELEAIGVKGGCSRNEDARPT